MFRRHGPTCLFLKTLRFKTSKVSIEMLDKFSGRMSMTNGKRLADLSPQKQQAPLMRLRMWQNSKNNLCSWKSVHEYCPKSPTSREKRAPWNMSRSYSFNYTELLWPAPAMEKQEFSSWSGRLWWFWTICRSRNRRSFGRWNHRFLRGLHVYPLQLWWVNH